MLTNDTAVVRIRRRLGEVVLAPELVWSAATAVGTFAWAAVGGTAVGIGLDAVIALSGAVSRTRWWRARSG